jgi:AraC-like DNA-binding protein
MSPILDEKAFSFSKKKKYADKRCLTPHYLSTVIKASTGKTDYEWMNDYVIPEAKALLKSDMTVQPISDSLSFPNQSFIGHLFVK